VEQEMKRDGRFATHKREHTGHVALDRIQDNVRDLVASVGLHASRAVERDDFFGRGVVVLDLRGASHTLTTQEFAASLIVARGTLYPGEEIVYPPTKSTHIRWLSNRTDGYVTVRCGGIVDALSPYESRSYIVDPDGIWPL
jgi:hypothetical protein